MVNEYFECQCLSDEHTIVFRMEVEPPYEPSVYVSYYIRDWEPWHKRVWKALKYIFSLDVEYGHFDCTIMRANDMKRLKSLCTEFIAADDRWHQQNGHTLVETAGITG